jgi:hypothetical protein
MAGHQRLEGARITGPELLDQVLFDLGVCHRCVLAV